MSEWLIEMPEKNSDESNMDGKAALERLLDDVLNPDEGTDEAQSGSHADEDITVGCVIDQLSRRSFGPLLIVPALVQASPLGGIPGMPIISGLLLILISAHMLVARHQLWVPDVLRKRSLNREKLRQGLRRLVDWLDLIAPLLRPRLEWLVSGPAFYLTSVICLLLSLSIIPLGLIPFAAAIPSLALAFIGLGLMLRDGLVIVISMLIIFTISLTAVFSENFGNQLSASFLP